MLADMVHKTLGGLDKELVQYLGPAAKAVMNEVMACDETAFDLVVTAFKAAISALPYKLPPRVHLWLEIGDKPRSVAFILTRPLPGYSSYVRWGVSAIEGENGPKVECIGERAFGLSFDVSKDAAKTTRQTLDALKATDFCQLVPLAESALLSMLTPVIGSDK